MPAGRWVAAGVSKTYFRASESILGPIWMSATPGRALGVDSALQGGRSGIAIDANRPGIAVAVPLWTGYTTRGGDRT